MRILLIGGAGVLGSALAEKFLARGFEVTILDVCRREEAWRLAGVQDSISYVWKSSLDLCGDDIRKEDVIVDSGLGVADRPLGNSSPVLTLNSNVHPSLCLLEAVRHLHEPKKPIVVYPSSFNALYGYSNGSKYGREMLPNPSSLYGWTKGAVELLYSTYHKAYSVPFVITRVGSGYGPRMRSDELPAKLMLKILQGKDLKIRSPDSKRLWTFVGDIVEFYANLIEVIDQYVGQTLHCAGNRTNEIVSNMDLAKLIKKISGSSAIVTTEEYEPGELVDGKPISFEVDNQSPLWKPAHSLEEGVLETFLWFKSNLWRFC